MSIIKINKMSREHSVRVTHFPYCIEYVEGKGWLILNREYKPIGFEIRDYIDYDNIPNLKYIKRITPAVRKKLIHNPNSDEARNCTNESGRMYLYDDSCIPIKSNSPALAAYMSRLTVLMMLNA